MPEMDMAAVKALGPGTLFTIISLSNAFFINLYPGSEIRGVPASVTIATLKPLISLLNINLNDRV